MSINNGATQVTQRNEALETSVVSVDSLMAMCAASPPSNPADPVQRLFDPPQDQLDQLKEQLDKSESPMSGCSPFQQAPPPPPPTPATPQEKLQDKPEPAATIATVAPAPRSTEPIRKPKTDGSSAVKPKPQQKPVPKWKLPRVATLGNEKTRPAAQATSPKKPKPTPVQKRKLEKTSEKQNQSNQTEEPKQKRAKRAPSVLPPSVTFIKKPVVQSRFLQATRAASVSGRHSALERKRESTVTTTSNITTKSAPATLTTMPPPPPKRSATNRYKNVKSSGYGITHKRATVQTPKSNGTQDPNDLPSPTMQGGQESEKKTIEAKPMSPPTSPLQLAKKRKPQQQAKKATEMTLMEIKTECKEIAKAAGATGMEVDIEKTVTVQTLQSISTIDGDEAVTQKCLARQKVVAKQEPDTIISDFTIPSPSPDTLSSPPTAMPARSKSITDRAKDVFRNAATKLFSSPQVGK
eukprot:TRINITY_DN69082_c0_g1_i1.p1 TRINITY_DN69082_c0_g1~~TRINITY_DN69082_c0_g1_i1.p1  ORF type:complete len:466 (-),score=76.33 TRINITY_DN69082_c0_g1_i1:157-1554(-)